MRLPLIKYLLSEQIRLFPGQSKLESLRKRGDKSYSVQRRKRILLIKKLSGDSDFLNKLILSKIQRQKHEMHPKYKNFFLERT